MTPKLIVLVQLVVVLAMQLDNILKRSIGVKVTKTLPQPLIVPHIWALIITPVNAASATGCASVKP